MKPASTTRSGASRVDRRRERGVEVVARRERAMLDDRVATPCAARWRARRRPRDWTITRRDVPPSAPRAHRRRAAAPRFEPRPEMRTVMRGVGMWLAGVQAASDDDGRRLARRQRDDRCRCAARARPRRRATVIARSACSGATTTAMPMPQLNTRCISSSATLPWRCSQSKIGGRVHAERARRACRPVGQHARHVLEQAAAGDVRHALDRQRVHQRQHRLHVDARRREQRVAERRAVERRAQVGAALRRRCGGSAKSRSSAVRSTRGRGPRRPATMLRPSMMPAFSTTPTAKPARSYSPARVHAGHLGGLAADQRAAGLLAARGDALDHLRRRRRRRACRRRSSRGRTAARRPARGCR